MQSRILTRFFCCLLLLWLAACQQPEDPPPGPLLSVGQRQISLMQFERELLKTYPDLQQLPEADQLPLKKQLVNRLIERKLLLGEAERLALQVDPDELDAAVAELRGNYSAAEFELLLQASGQSLASWTSALKLRLLTEKVSERVIAPQAQVSQREVEDYYLANKDEFRRPAELRARQMLLPDLESAQRVLKRLKAGEKFADLARAESLSPDREDGGLLGYFSQGELPPLFDRVLFSLPTGRVSDPVESPYGVHLFLVERRRKAGLRPFKQVEQEIIDKLSQQREEEVFQQWLEGLHQQTQVRINWTLLEPAPGQRP